MVDPAPRGATTCASIRRRPPSLCPICPSRSPRAPRRSPRAQCHQHPRTHPRRHRRPAARGRRGGGRRSRGRGRGGAEPGGRRARACGRRARARAGRPRQPGRQDQGHDAADDAAGMPLRGDFDNEWHDEAELLLGDMEFLDEPQRGDLKVEVLLDYNRTLDERRGATLCCRATCSSVRDFLQGGGARARSDRCACACGRTRGTTPRRRTRGCSSRCSGALRKRAAHLPSARRAASRS